METKARIAAILVWACACAVMLGPTPATAAEGDPDPTFAGDGRVALRGAGSFVARSVALQADGRIVVAGHSCEPDADAQDGTCLARGDASFRLARLTPDGGLDAEFGDGGLVTTRVGAGRSQAFDVLVLPSGAIVAAGVAIHPRHGDVLALARYDARGALDPGFGGDGVALHRIGDGFTAATGLAAGPGGTLLVTGQAGERFMVARFTAAGELDASFGDDGAVVAGPGYGYGTAVAATTGGDVVAAGLAGTSRDPATYRFGVLRLSAAGEADPGFGEDGFAQQAVGSTSSFATSAAAMPDGGWVAAGAATVPDGRQAMAVVRGGAPGAGGAVAAWTSLATAGEGAFAADVHGLADGRVVAAGHVAPAAGGLVFATARLAPDGRLDPAYGSGGFATVGWDQYPFARATAAAVQADGRIVTAGVGCVGGTGRACTGGTAVVLVARQLARRAVPPGDPGPAPTPTPTPTSPPSPAPDVSPPVGQLSGVPARIRRSKLRRRGLGARVTAAEPVTIAARLAGRDRRGGWVLLARTGVDRPTAAARLRLVPARRAMRRLRRRPIHLLVELRDPAGNTTRLRTRVDVR